MTNDMSSSSSISSSELSSLDDGTLAHTHAEASHSACGPPWQLCQYTKYVSQILQKSYICAEHIEQFGRYRGLLRGAASSHVVSVIFSMLFVLFDISYFSRNSF
jgi:hypothetical protein